MSFAWRRLKHRGGEGGGDQRAMSSFLKTGNKLANENVMGGEEGRGEDEGGVGGGGEEGKGEKKKEVEMKSNKRAE